MHDAVQEIIKAAACAPSVANSQPWFFSLSNNTLSVHIDKKRAESFCNSGNTFSYITFGGVIENIVIAANHFGFDAKLDISSEDKINGIIAQIELVKGAPVDSSRYEFIFKRHTNRRRFKKSPIPTHISNSLIATADSFNGAHLHWVEDQATIDRLALLVKEADTIMYEHPRLHSDLFKWIRWTDEEIHRTGDGLSIKTLEINKLQESCLKILSSWKTMNFLNKFSVSRLISDYSRKLVKSSPAIGLIVMDNNAPEDYFNGGRLFERIWLMATSHGLSLHPMCPVVILPTVYHLFDGKGFDGNHQNTLRRAFDQLAEIFQITKDNALIMLFRAGYAIPPTEHSLRRPIEEVMPT